MRKIGVENHEVGFAVLDECFDFIDLAAAHVGRRVNLPKRLGDAVCNDGTRRVGQQFEFVQRIVNILSIRIRCDDANDNGPFGSLVYLYFVQKRWGCVVESRSR